MKQWNSIIDLLSTISRVNGKVIVLRNYEGYIEGKLSNHDDIDLLCDEPEIIKRIIDGDEVEGLKNKIQIFSKVCDNEISIDLRYVGDGYMDAKWEKDLLDRRVLLDECFYVPSGEDYAYSLLYHGLYHKKVLAEDYKSRVIELSNRYGLGLSEISFMDKLKEYMSNNKYSDTGYRCG